MQGASGTQAFRTWFVVGMECTSRLRPYRRADGPGSIGPLRLLVQIAAGQNDLGENRHAMHQVMPYIWRRRQCMEYRTGLAGAIH